MKLLIESSKLLKEIKTIEIVKLNQLVKSRKLNQHIAFKGRNVIIKFSVVTIF